MGGWISYCGWMSTWKLTDGWVDFLLWVDGILRPPLSGTFLQTLPDLVTPLKGHSIFISAQLSSDSVSALRRFGY